MSDEPITDALDTGTAVDSGKKKRRGFRTCLVRLAFVVFAPFAVLLSIELVWQIVGDPRIPAYEEYLAGRPPHFRLAQMGMLRLDPDPEISYTTVPGFDKTVAGIRYRIDPNGFRGAPVTVEKPEGIKRVLVLGDSYAFGFGVAEKDTIGSQLRRALEPEHPGIEVMTLGVPGYQTGQEERVLRRDALQFKPDAVVLVYYANDNFEHASMYDPRLKLFYNDELPLPHSVKLFLSRSILYSEITKRYTRILAASGQLDSRGLYNWPVTAARLKRIASLLAETGIGFVLVAIPALDNSMDFIDMEHVYNKDHDRLLALAKSDGIGTIDVRAILLRRAPRPIEELFVSVKPSDSHLTAEGYALIVKDLHAHIKANHVLR